MSNNGLLSSFQKLPVGDALGGVRSIPVITPQIPAVISGAANGAAISTAVGVTIPRGLYVGFNTMIYNDSAAAIIITIATGVTARISAVATPKTSVSLAAYGICSIWANKQNTIVLSGDVA
jgi:hypothetical protein